MAEEYIPQEEAAPERRRRLLTMYEMTGNPFLQGSPYSSSLRQGGASGSFDEPKPPPFTMLDVPQLAPQQATSAALRGTPAPQPTRRAAVAAADTDLTSIPTQGPQGSRGARAPAAAAPVDPVSAAQQKVYDAMDRQMQEMKMPDMSEAVNAYRQRYAAAGPDMILGMAMSEMGGRGGREYGGQILKNALAQRQAQTTDYGTLDQSGFTADPMKEREFKIARGERQIAMLETIARNADTLAERKAAREAAERLRRDTLQMHREQMAKGKFAHYEDKDTGQTVIYNTLTGDPKAGSAPAAAPGAGGVEGLPPGLADMPRIPGNLKEPQGKAVYYGMRAAQAAQQLEALGTDYSYASVGAKSGLERVPHVGGLASTVYNATMGKNEQLAEQAQRNFINAILRPESGAVINPDEFANARVQYFPEPGDDAEKIAQKKLNRETAIRGLMVEAGPRGAQLIQQAVQRRPAPAAERKLPKATLGGDVNRYKDAVRN